MTRVRIGKKKILFDSDFNEALFYERNEGKNAVIEIQRKRRTLTQNAYYWVYLTVISNETGNTPDDLHELFKSMFLPDVIVKIKGKKATHDFKRKKSTTELTKFEFGEYLDRICAYTEVPLPNPADAGYISNY